MKANTLTILGVIATIAGGAATLLGNWVSDKKTEEMIEEKVQAALREKEEDKEANEEEAE